MTTTLPYDRTRHSSSSSTTTSTPIAIPSCTNPLDEADINRFATLFAPATPPATPTATFRDQLSRPQHLKHRTHSSQSEFGDFVSVPAAQDPLSFHFPAVDLSAAQVPYGNNSSLNFFDHFTSTAKTASEQNRRIVLDELLEHEDHPLYFIQAHNQSISSSPQQRSASPCRGSTIPIPSPSPIPQSGILIDADTIQPPPSPHKFPMLIKPSQSPIVTTRAPLPPRLTGTTSPPSAHTPSASTSSLHSASTTTTTTTTTSPPSSSSTPPAHATLSRISSSWVSGLLPSAARSRQSTSTSTSTFVNSAAGTSSNSNSVISSTFPSSLSHHAHAHVPVPVHVQHHNTARRTPFSAREPFIPPSGAPGFMGDRNWDKGFSDSLEEEELSEVKGVLGKGKKGMGTGTGTGKNNKGTGTGIGKGRGRGLALVGRREGTVCVLTETIANLIHPHLPALVRLPRTWTLLYSLDQHGISLNTLYSRCEPKVPCTTHGHGHGQGQGATKGALVVVRDAGDAIFGAWMGEGLWLERGGYYGSGESFLWRYSPSPRLSSKKKKLGEDENGDGNGNVGDEDEKEVLEEEEEEEGTLDLYKWTGKNDYVALCEPGFISFGGGDGHYGLYLDASLLDGSSAPCPTFDNPVLCSGSGSGSGLGSGLGLEVDGGAWGSHLVCSGSPGGGGGVGGGMGAGKNSGSGASASGGAGKSKKKDVNFECVGLEVWGVGPDV